MSSDRGRCFRFGAQVVLIGLEQDRRCAMITLDPGTATANPDPLRIVKRGHGGMAGIYAAVVAEGMMSRGDAVVLRD
jgi:hypothetical protein